MTANRQNEKMEELTKRLEEGVRQVFESGRYAEYMQVMSRLHRYSYRNTLLIAMQRPGATMVAGYQSWQKYFGRQVNRGEKAIQIFSPAPYRTKRQMDIIDPATHQAVLNPDGSTKREEVEVTIPSFKVASVFDVSQTTGRPIPTLFDNIDGDVHEFEDFMKAIREASPVPIAFEEMHGKDGYYELREKRIALKSDMSQRQTIAAAIHEMAHAKLHSLDFDHLKESLKARGKDNKTMEVEAESIAYVVSQHYGVETGENSFGYIASWSKNKELPELQASLQIISDTSNEIIEAMDACLLTLKKEREAQKPLEWVTYYVAECDEYHLIEGHPYFRYEQLADAVAEYRAIQDEPARQYMGPSLGIIYHHKEDSLSDGAEVSLIKGKTIQADVLDDITFMAESPVVLQVVEAIRMEFPDYEYKPMTHIKAQIYPENMTIDELADAIDRIAYDFDTYHYQDTLDGRTDMTAEICLGLSCEQQSSYIGFLHDIVDDGGEIAVRAGVLIERLKAFEAQVNPQMEPVCGIEFCQKEALFAEDFIPLSKMDEKVTELNQRYASDIDQMTGQPKETVMVNFRIYYCMDGEIQSQSGSIDIGSKTGGLLDSMEALVAFKLDDIASAPNAQLFGGSTIEAVLREQHEKILPYLRSFCNGSDQTAEHVPELRHDNKPKKDNSINDTVEKNVTQKNAVSDVKTAQAEKKKSIHERLAANKEMLAGSMKSQNQKGVELA